MFIEQRKQELVQTFGFSDSEAEEVARQWAQELDDKPKMNKDRILASEYALRLRAKAQSVLGMEETRSV